MAFVKFEITLLPVNYVKSFFDNVSNFCKTCHCISDNIGCVIICITGKVACVNDNEKTTKKYLEKERS